jgi:transposase
VRRAASENRGPKRLPHACRRDTFYRTERGAHVGDVFMSLIHTAELCGVNPFDYLRALMAHPDEVAAHPAEWLPWNYERSTLAVAA